MFARLSAALLVVALASCTHERKHAASLEEDLASIAPVEASFDTDLPRTSDRIVVSATEVRISGDPYRVARVPLERDDVEGTVLFPLRLALHGREHEADAGSSDKPPSTQALLEMMAGSRTLVVADKRTPFAVLAPVVMTAATGAPPTVYLVAGGKKPSALQLHAELAPPERRGEPDYAPRLLLDTRGVTITVNGSVVGRGCNDEGATGSVTVPKRDGEEDDAAILACAESLHRAFGRLAEDAFLVTASPETDLATLVRVIEPFRRTFTGVSLFVPHGTKLVHDSLFRPRTK